MRSPEREAGETLSDDKWVRLCPDHAGSCIDAKDSSNAGEDELPVSNGLKDRLRKWCSCYAESTFYKAADDPGFNADFPLEAFAVEGLAIARAIKAELPDWTVVYLDVSRLYGPSRRADYQYEVL